MHLQNRWIQKLQILHMHSSHNLEGTELFVYVTFGQKFEVNGQIMYFLDPRVKVKVKNGHLRLCIIDCSLLLSDVVVVCFFFCCFCCCFLICCFFVLFFHNKSLFSKMPSLCQSVWIQIRPDILSFGQVSTE